MNYIGIVHKENESIYGVSFPDFPGCVTANEDASKLKEMAQEALDLHVGSLKADKTQLPTPSNIVDIYTDPNYADTLAYLVVSVPSENDKPECYSDYPIDYPHIAAERDCSTCPLEKECLEQTQRSRSSIPSRKDIERLAHTDILINKAMKIHQQNSRLTHEEIYRMLIQVMSLQIARMMALQSEMFMHSGASLEYEQI